MSDLNLNIFTPEGVIVSGLEVESLIIPTSTGQINVLKGHTQLLTKMGTGVLKVKTSKGEKSYTMSGGLCKVLGSEVTILSDKTEVID